MEDMYLFLTGFVRDFPRFASRDFYIVGESFGGTWVPALAHKIHQKQSSPMADIVRSTSTSDASFINLKGIGLGNAQLSQALQWPGFYATGCTGDKPVFNASICAVMEADMSECVAMLEICSGSPEVCGPVLEHCRQSSVNLVFEAGLNPYDFRQRCEQPPLCYEEPTWIEEYLNTTEARNLLGVPSDVQLNLVDMELNSNFVASGALAVDPIQWVEELLDKVRAIHPRPWHRTARD